MRQLRFTHNYHRGPESTLKYHKAPDPGLQAIKEYLRSVDPRLDQDQDHDRDQGRLRENAVQSREGAPREASGQEGTARGALFFVRKV